MVCEILITRRNGQESAGEIILAGGKLTVKPAQPKYGNMLREMLTEEHFAGGKPVTAESDMLAWFRSLPTTYNGSYLRAKIIS